MITPEESLRVNELLQCKQIKKTVTIPTRADHGGWDGYAMKITIPWCCPLCGCDWSEPLKGFSWDGSRYLGVDCWGTECRHTPNYARVRQWIITDRWNKLANVTLPKSRKLYGFAETRYGDSIEDFYTLTDLLEHYKANTDASYCYFNGDSLRGWHQLTNAELDALWATISR